MANLFQPPPTFAEVVLIDPRTNLPSFNPVWLKWFVDVVKLFNTAGGAEGISPLHNDTQSLQGGTANQYYHLSAAQHASVAALGNIASQAASAVAITGGTIDNVAITDGTIDNAPIGGGTPAAGAFTDLSAAGVFHPATPASVAQTSASIYAGSGAPSDVDAADGDYYFRSDGGAGTHLYFKAAGAWAAVI